MSLNIMLDSATGRAMLRGASMLALLIGNTAPAFSATLQSAYSPPVNNGGGTNPQRTDIITLQGATDVIQGDYNLVGTSARRFQYDSASIAVRNMRGEVVSGFAAVDGRTSLALGTQQKIASITYPDQIQGTNLSTLVYDNDALAEISSTSAKTLTVYDTHAPVYGDLRIADIAGSVVTIGTGDKGRIIYDPANFAILTADSGSTLYNVSAGSAIVYDARTATMDGADQGGLSQGSSVSVQVPVTTYSGVAFGSGDKVTDLPSLKRYNIALIAQLSSGAITPNDYENRIQAAVSTAYRTVVVSTPAIPLYTAPPTSSGRIFIKLDGSSLTTTADSQLVGVVVADGNSDGISTLISARNGSAVVNRGIIVQGEGGPGIRLSDAGTSLINDAGGTIGVGYETLDRSGGSPVPTGLSDYLGEGTGNQAIRASDGATVINNGTVNVANRDIPGHDEDPTFGKANAGIVTLSGATSVNTGTILIGGAASAVANTLGLYGGAAGMVADNGGVATNAAGGTIRIGTSFAENSADLAAVQDVVSINYAAGMVSLAGGAITNDGAIRIGSLAQNATGMTIGGDAGTGTNNGSIVIDHSALTRPSAPNVAIRVLGSSIAGAIEATNSATGLISVNGVNGIGLLVENAVPGGSARAANAGTIVVDGGLSADKLRNYGVYVSGTASSAAQDGAVILTGEGAIGVHARNGGTIDVGSSGTLDFQAANQIGYYTLGAGSTIAVGSAASTDVDTAGSTGFRAEGGARITGSRLMLDISGRNAVGIVGTGASSGTTIDMTASHLSISGAGATGVVIEGGATGRLGSGVVLDLAGNAAIAAVVDGQGHSLDGSAAGVPIAATSLTSNAILSSGFADLTGYVARNQAQLANTGDILFTGADGTGIRATTGATATNSGHIAIGAGGTGIQLISAGSSDVVTGNDTGVLTIDGGRIDHRTRGIQAGGAGATANLRTGAMIVLNGDGAIGAEAIDGGHLTLVSNIVPIFSMTATDQIAFHVAGAGATIVGAPGTLDASGVRSTLFRFDDGAQGNFGGSSNLSASGPGSAAIIAAGAGTAVTAGGTAFAVSGAGASALAVYGGAVATLDGATRIAVAGPGYAAIVDGRTSGLDGSFGSPAIARLTSAATVTGAGDGATGYAIRNGATLIHTGTVALAGVDATGILVEGPGSSATQDGNIGLTGASGNVGAHIANGGALISNGTIDVASGTGIFVEGAGSTLTGNAALLASAENGIAALRLLNGGSVVSASNFTAGGTAHGILIDTGAGALVLGNGTIRVTGTGNGIENGAGSSAVLLQGTRISVEGAGSGIRTGVALDPASNAHITVSGINGTGFTFTNAGGAQTANDLALGAGFDIVASGAGATGVRLGTTGTAALAGRISVTGIAGGAALVGGPAAMITNSGSLVSASMAAPVVDLRGGTRAFTNSGTIAGPAPAAVAIRGGDNGQAVTLSAGSVVGAVLLGSGADDFLMTGGTLVGALDSGAGDDSATFRGLTDTNLSGTTRIAGSGQAGGNDRLTFDNSVSTGTRRLTGWNVVNLVNGSGLRADGDLTLVGPSVMTIDATSTLYAGAGVNPVLTSSTVRNAGTIDLTNGTSGANDRLTIRGDYAGQNGTLKLDTILGGDGSPSDRLIIDGGAASGQTSIRISASGLGATTSGDGIEVIGAINGGTTTATSTRDAFALAGTHIDAGAYEYRLYASNVAGTSQSWYLRSFAESSLGTPVPTYRIEVPLLAAVPNLARQGDLDVLGTYHKRMGDEASQVAQGMTAPGRLWGRIIVDDVRFRQGGDASPEANGHINGFQIGADLFRYGDAGGGHHDIGLYGGHSTADTRVSGFAGGLEDQYAGKLHVNTTYAGLYWTYAAGSGFYVDTVLQRSWYGGHADAASGSRVGIDGTGILASLEAGYGIRLSSIWTLEPQAQLIVQGVRIRDAAIAGATVAQRSPGYVTGRLGARLKGRFDTKAGSVQPYVRGNVWKGFTATDRAIFTNAAASTVIDTPTSSLWGEGGIGISWSLTPALTVYGEADHRFTLDHDRGVSGRSTGVSAGIKARF